MRYNKNGQFSVISTHALREEGDAQGGDHNHRDGDFYPRPPRGGRPMRYNKNGQFSVISTHALREEGDASSRWPRAHTVNFYPRPPRGGRRHSHH